MKPQTTLKIGIALSIGALFLLSAMAAPMTSESIHAQALTSNAFNQPEPYMQTNVTWQKFNSSMHFNEYLNDTGQPSYLNVEPANGNYISIDTNDIQSKDLQGDNLSTGPVWDNTAWGIYQSPQGGATLTENLVKTTQELSLNTSKASNTFGKARPIYLSESEYPSNNIAYDFLTFGMYLQGSPLPGAVANLQIWNSTPDQTTIGNIIPGESVFESISLAQIEKESGLGLNTTGKNSSSGITLYFEIALPQATSSYTYTLYITSMAFTSYPISLGLNATGKPVFKSKGNAELSVYDPTIPMNITDGGYTETLIQPFSSLPNSQITSSPLAQSEYIEQVTYQGNFELPSAPGISYGATSLRENLTVPSTQVAVLDINGVSYLNAISGKNGTVVLVSAVNPNTNTSFLQITDYTSSQWNEISGPPGFFSVAGIEYYFDEIVLSIIALVGIGGGAAAIKTYQLRRVK